MPQVFYECVLPELQVNEDSTKERVSSFHIIKPASKWLWLTMVSLIIAAIVIGVVVEI